MKQHITHQRLHELYLNCEDSVERGPPVAIMQEATCSAGQQLKDREGVWKPERDVQTLVFIALLAQIENKELIHFSLHLKLPLKTLSSDATEGTENPLQSTAGLCVSV